MLRSSLYAGTIAMRRSGDMRFLAQPDQVEEAAGAVAVGVLLEHPLPRAAPQLLRPSRLLEQLAVRGDGLVGARDDDDLGARLEPALDPLVGIGDDRGAGRGELEQPAR